MHQQVRQPEEHHQQLQQQIDQSLSVSQQAIKAAKRREEEAQERIRELEGQNRNLQWQVSSVVFHHTCMCVCSVWCVCRWLLLCPHTHSLKERSTSIGW